MHVKFRIGRMTVWFFPFWWGNDYCHAVGSGWRCLSWVIRSRSQP
jgi:hypothetical protein